MSDPATLIERQTQLADLLVAGWPVLAIPGLPAVSAAAAVGNATQENNCLSVTIGPLDSGSNGLFQWRLDRLTAMQAFGVRHFGVWGAIEPQAAFFSYECKGDFPKLWADLVDGAKPLATLTLNICDQYEKPAPAAAAFDKRIGYATKFMEAWKPVSHETPLAAITAIVSSPVLITELTPSHLVVVQALANAILLAKTTANVSALANAILREVA